MRLLKVELENGRTRYVVPRNIVEIREFYGYRNNHNGSYLFLPLDDTIDDIDRGALGTVITCVDGSILVTPRDLDHMRVQLNDVLQG